MKASYATRDPRYFGEISSHKLRIASGTYLPVEGSLDTAFEFARDQGVLSNLVLVLPKSQIKGSVTVSHLNDPEVKSTLTAQLDAAEIGRILKITQIRSGSLTVSGDAQYARRDFEFKGKLNGKDLAYRDRGLSIDRVAVHSDLNVSKQGASLPNLVISALDASVTGNAELAGFRQFDLEGTLRGLRLTQAAGFFFGRSIVWEGIVSGPVAVKATLDHGFNNLTLVAKANIVPAQSGTPLGGSVDLEYQQNGDALRFGDSHVLLPHSTVDLAGTLGETFRVKLDSSDLNDFEPVLELVVPAMKGRKPVLSLEQGHAHFDGTVTGPFDDPNVNGRLSLTRVRYRQHLIDSLNATIGVGKELLAVDTASLAQGPLVMNISGRLPLRDWTPDRDSTLLLHANIRNADIRALMAQLSMPVAPRFAGSVNATFDIAGSISKPTGKGRLILTKGLAYGEQIDLAAADVILAEDRVTVENGRLRESNATVTFQGSYNRSHESWTHGEANLKVNGGEFPMSSLRLLQRYQPELSGNINFHATAASEVSPQGIRIKFLNGDARLRDVSLFGVSYGDMSVNAVTEGERLQATFNGHLRDSQISGAAQMNLTGDYPAQGILTVGALRFATVQALLPAAQAQQMPFDGLVQGGINFHGSLSKWRDIEATARIENIRVSPGLNQQGGPTAIAQDLTLHNVDPVVIEIAHQAATLHNARLVAKDTQIDATGRVAFNKTTPMDLALNGRVNLQVLRILDPHLVSSGASNLNARVSGTLFDPAITGTLELRDASLNLETFPNGLDHANGLIRFDRNRATIQQLTALSGGGKLSLSGFVSFGGGGPLVYRLEAAADNVRVRYAGAVSVSFNAALKFTGTSEQSLLSGTLTVTRAAVSGNADLGGLFAATMGPSAAPVSDKDILRGVQLDIRIESAPSLQLSTSLSQDVQAEIDLRLRGTPSRPAVLGRVSMNEGQIQVFGSKYTINRGEVNFVNAAKIEPVLDLDLETQARGVIVNITVSGTLNKLNVSYRSDPPLQSSEIIALLAVGRAPDQSVGLVNSQAATQSSFSSVGNTILGQAVSPGSSRLQRFFGVTHLKIDPQLQGIENVPQARLTLEQQISREITITYVTNLSRTSEQIFRFEWALSRQYSFVAIRDENGLFGVDLQYKRRFK